MEVPLPPHFEFEERLLGLGFHAVAGVDEAGRGPLAGPVAAAAVILDPCDLPIGLDDSKALSAARRDELFGVILAKAFSVGFGLASVAEIDHVNIRQATFRAMRRAVGALAKRPVYVLVDGNDPPPLLPCPVETVVKGDALSVSIAAASIVAKVMRDRLMVRLHDQHPQYGFALHKGYATPAHREALRRHGPSSCHRRSFCTSAANSVADMGTEA